jgi:hypothetical protein
VWGGEFFGHDVVKIGGVLKERSWGLTERGTKLTMNAKEPTSLCRGRIGFSAYHAMCGGCRADRIPFTQHCIPPIKFLVRRHIHIQTPFNVTVLLVYLSGCTVKRRLNAFDR